MNFNIPESLKSRIEEIARREYVSADQFVASAIAEKISAMQTEKYIEQRAKRGSRTKFEAARYHERKQLSPASRSTKIE